LFRISIWEGLGAWTVRMPTIKNNHGELATLIFMFYTRLELL